MKKIIITTIAAIALFAATDCSSKGDHHASTCTEDERAKIVKLLRNADSWYYDEERGPDSANTIKLEPGYYHYETETEGYYLVCLGQDGPYTIPKNDATITEWTAEQGHGYVLFYNQKQETIYLKSKPSDSAKTLETFTDPDGIPEDAECLGIVNEWYKVKYLNKTGYVRRSMSTWSVNCADACGEIR